MRVTDLTKQNSVIRNIAFNSEKLQNLSKSMASGKRISKLSDDPVAATQVQDNRTRISFFDTLQRNIRQNFVWLDRTEQEIAQIGDLLGRAKVLTLAQANASGDAATRSLAAQELQQIIDGILQAGNAKVGKVFVFSGSKTFTRPLTVNDSVRPAFFANGERRGLSDRAVFEGNSSNTYIVRITRAGPMGKARFKVSDDGGESWSREKTLLPSNELVNENGKPSDKVVLRHTDLTPPQGQEELIFSEGLSFLHFPNPPVAYKGNSDHRLVETGEGILLPLNVTAADLFFAKPDDPDSIEVFNLLFGLKRALLDNDQAAVEKRLDEVDRAFDQVLDSRAHVGAVRKEMEDRLSKLNDRVFSKTQQVSELEDLDFAKAVVDMNVADARHRASLDTAGRLIQPSLLNFLR